MPKLTVQPVKELHFPKSAKKNTCAKPPASFEQSNLPTGSPVRFVNFDSMCKQTHTHTHARTHARTN